MGPGVNGNSIVAGQDHGELARVCEINRVMDRKRCAFNSVAADVADGDIWGWRVPSRLETTGRREGEAVL